MKIERFEDIEAWQLGRELTRQVYEGTKQGDFARDFGFIAYLVRSGRK